MKKTNFDWRLKVLDSAENWSEKHLSPQRHQFPPMELLPGSLPYLFGDDSHLRAAFPQRADFFPSSLPLQAFETTAS